MQLFFNNSATNGGAIYMNRGIKVKLVFIGAIEQVIKQVRC